MGAAEHKCCVRVTWLHPTLEPRPCQRALTLSLSRSLLRPELGRGRRSARRGHLTIRVVVRSGSCPVEA